MTEQLGIFEQELNDTERAVLREIRKRDRQNPIMIREIKTLFGFSDRKVKDIAKWLLEEQRFPIGSSKDKPAGYFWCTTKQDRIAAARPIIAQIRSEGRRVAILLQKDDLNELDGQERLLADACFAGELK